MIRKYRLGLLLAGCAFMLGAGASTAAFASGSKALPCCIDCSSGDWCEDVPPPCTYYC